MRDGEGHPSVVVLHGARGAPDTNWFLWLHAALHGEGVEVLRPGFPTPVNQSPDAWLEAHGRAVDAPPPAPAILVGHSLGAAFALRLVERADRPIAGLFLAAGFIGPLGLPDYDGINASFFSDPFDWIRIGERRGRIGRCWAGDDDPYVPLARSRAVADALRVPLDVVRGGRHLDGEAGFGAVPQLLGAILAARG